ncbi:phenylpropionate dioxygenase ferredoxin reductase subunit [Shigella dysenteriae]|nr:phenylpropionate dioxygenase ferredoxin reductase subunit [Shigella dysenteriae]
MKEKTIIIVGGGQAAAMAAASLRQQGFTGELHLFSDEQHLPYERPPLSKSMLLQDSPQLQSVLPAHWWQENNVHLHSGVTIKTLGRDTRELVLANGESWHWDQLFIATGAAARPLPLLDALGERCFTLRHAGDAARLREVLQPERSVVIVGAGTIGLELAASATQRRCKVTVIELAATIMGRNAPPPVQRYLLQHHQQAGVRILLNNAIEHVVDGEKVELTLQSGETLQADVVIYGIGISANDQLAREANLDTANGIVIDEACRTCDPAIFACGDVAITRLDNGALQRCESWENANNQAQIAAATMLGLPLPLLPPPWFWSDQYSDNLQFIGDMRGDDWLCRGNPETQKAIWFNLQNGVLIGAVTLNQGREIRPIRKWIQSGKTFDAKLLIDENIALKSL